MCACVRDEDNGCELNVNIDRLWIQVISEGSEWTRVFASRLV